MATTIDEAESCQLLGATKNATSSDKPGDKKEGKTGSTIWCRQCKVPNANEVDSVSLLRQMHSEAMVSFKYWTRKASMFRGSHFGFTIVIMIVQIAQIVIFQLNYIPGSIKSALAVVIPSVTAAIFTLQAKLGWFAKAQKSKRSAAFFDKIAKHTKYRLELMQYGGEVNDSVKLWNAALMGDATEIPPFLMPF